MGNLELRIVELLLRWTLHRSSVASASTMGMEDPEGWIVLGRWIAAMLKNMRRAKVTNGKLALAGRGKEGVRDGMGSSWVDSVGMRAAITTRTGAFDDDDDE